MKTRIYGVLLAAAVLCSSPLALSQAAPKAQSQKSAARTNPSTGTAAWKKIPIPPLPPFKPQQPTRIELKNGMVIFLQENHELPLINGFARIRGGARSEPAEKVGLVDIYGDVWRTGGTVSQTGDQMDDFLEARAAKIESDGGTDSTTLGFDCLKQDFPDVFKLFVDVLRNPAFRQDKIDLSKNQMNTGISRRNDSSASIAGREAGFLAFGKENPYVREPEYYTVKAITRDDLVKWHKDHVAPNNIMLGIEGDFDSKQVEALLRQTFETWERGAQIAPPKIDFTPAKPGIYVADKEDVNQSEIRMVELGIDRHNPDYFAVSVFNEVFGGGFASRLFSNLRTKMGLAYSVGGGIGSAFDHPGMTRLSMGTKTESTADAIKGMWDQIDQLKTNPPTEAELKRAKDSVLNSFIFNFDTPGKVLREKMTYEYYGYPADFLEKYRTEVEKVTVADLARVSQKYLHKDKLAILVVGNAKEFEPAVAKLSPVTKIDYSIPTAPPGAQKAEAAPAASNPEGKALIAKVVQAIGGAEKLASVKAVRHVLQMKQKTPQGDMELKLDQTTVYPDKRAAKIATPMGEMTQVISPEVAYMAMQGQTRDLPASIRADAVSQIKRDFLCVAQHANDPAYSFTAEGTEKVGDVNGTVLRVSFAGLTNKWVVDPQTGHILRISYEAVGQAGPVQHELTYSDWKTVDGLTVPMAVSIEDNGQPTSSVQVTEMQVNPPIDPKLFEKPSTSAPK